MYKRKVSSWEKHMDFALIDVISIEISLIIACIIRHGLRGSFDVVFYSDMAVVIMLVDFVVMFFNESYRGILRRGLFKEFTATLKHMALVSIVFTTYLFFVQKSSQFSRITFLCMWCISFMLSFLVRQLRKKVVLGKACSEGGKKRSMLIITTNQMALSLVKTLVCNNFDDICISGVVVVDDVDRNRKVHGIPVVANGDTVSDYICRHWVDEVFVDLPNDYQGAAGILDACYQMGVVVHLNLAKVCDMQGQRQMVEKFAGYTVLSSSISMATSRELFLKRMIDICGGMVGVFMTGILFLFVAPCIYIKSPGPIFFTQFRIGKNGRKFKLYKFRSMYLDAEERKIELVKKNKMSDGLMFKMDKDPRIIKGIGEFIRKTSIDEFPQFLNVLKGDMSLVGTRPPTVDEWNNYELHHRKRLAIKPGVTGMWQVSGRSNITNFDDVVELDTKYITEWSFGLDLSILFKTLLVVLKREGSV